MDHIASIDTTGDTTFALALEAQNRGHQLFHYTPDRLQLQQTRLLAAVEAMTLRDVVGDHYDLGEPVLTDLSEMDVILLRQDPPFDMAYITYTHMLDHIHPQTLVVNDPTSVRNFPEKLFVMEFDDLMPQTLITRDKAAIVDFRNTHKDIIIKPLYGNGGAGVFRITPQDQNLTSLLEMFEHQSPEPIIAQRYLADVRSGDKRIILVDGEPVGAINRVPPEGDARSNMHIGGTAEPSRLSEREQEICDRIGPRLRELGFIFTGIDVIGGYMTEINVTSPTGIREMKRFDGTDIAALFWDAVQSRLH